MVLPEVIFDKHQNPPWTEIKQRPLITHKYRNTSCMLHCDSSQANVAQKILRTTSLFVGKTKTQTSEVDHRQSGVENQ